MAHNNKTACIFGGTGFIGRQVVRELAAKGYRIKVVTRAPESAYFLKPCGDVGQVVPVACNYKDEKNIADVIKGSDVVVNAIGILFERGRRAQFDYLHAKLPGIIAKASKKAGVKSLIHISALGIENSTSRYAKSKLEGEKAVRSGFKNSVILRPSIVFGEDDNFFNMFARLASVLPFLPLIGGGKTKFQPVYVGDVADAVIHAVEHNTTQGKTYELGGNEILTFKEIYERLLLHSGLKARLIPLPFFMAKIEAAFLQMLPNPLLTIDQVESLKADSIVSEDALTLETLGIEAHALDAILPTYLEQYRPGGRFANH